MDLQSYTAPSAGLAEKSVEGVSGEDNPREGGAPQREWNVQRPQGRGVRGLAGQRPGVMGHAGEEARR